MREVPPDLVRRAAALADAGGRRLLGVTGPPGAGKSTVAEMLVAALPGRAVLLPMDGFHLDAEDLDRRGLSDVKGAPETFDPQAYVNLLRRLRSGAEASAPTFDRSTERTVPDALRVPGDVPLVVTEGNYLLLDEGPWALVRPLLDECWYVDVPDAVRVPRLIARHVAHGRTPEAARAWVLRSDEANARRVALTRGRADAVLTWD